MAEDLETFAAFARLLARAARRETLPGCRAPLEVENKLSEGFDPITEHDRNSERAMRRLIEDRFPDHGIAGEERRLATSACRRLEDARLSTTDPYLFEGAEAAGFEQLRRSARLTRYGLDAYGYALVAAGSLDIVAESGLKPHDYHALVPLVRAAGGTGTGSQAKLWGAAARLLAARRCGDSCAPQPRLSHPRAGA